jgi:hypothetical protein
MVCASGTVAAPAGVAASADIIAAPAKRIVAAATAVSNLRIRLLRF